MKRLSFMIAFLALIIAGTMTAMPNTNDNHGHVLGSLWKEYDQAVNADKPKTELEVLGRIKAEAIRQKQPWDFYDAASKAIDARTRINWKDSQKAREDFRKETESHLADGVFMMDIIRNKMERGDARLR